ncbi:MAG: sigma-54-dependent Fis family transcriptional regulator [Candidatus Zixiibacteriota bacterium]|nr:MAG: sigma-54-dependent Fis family transcriptional regulator [candidate division Zixibacteria bacterium]
MILVFSHDISFSNRIIEKIGDGEIISDETHLASAARERKPECIIFDLRSGIRPFRFLERVYMEEPDIIIIVILPAVGLTEEILSDKEFYWPVDPEKISEEFKNIGDDRKLLEDTGIVGRSDDLIKAAKVVKKLALSDVNVLITGPSGAGKEVIARAIHKESGKPESPFIAVNIAAMAPGIIESELFGHEKGAFTSASSRRIGVFEQASDGIIFLDEIGEIPLEIQAKLLRVLEERSFSRVGGNVKIEANFRLVAATNKNLIDEVNTGRFREDLYYRLSVVSIGLPALHDRIADISPLAFHFLEERKEDLKSDRLKIESRALRLFHRYEWPGNVRELRNVVYSFSVTSTSGRIRAEDFEKYIHERKPRSNLLPVVTGRTPEAAEHQIMMQALMALTGEIKELRFLIESELEKMRGGDSSPVDSFIDRSGSMKVDDAEKELIMRALDESGGNRKRAAEILGMGERTLYRKLDKYGLR